MIGQTERLNIRNLLMEEEKPLELVFPDPEVVLEAWQKYSHSEYSLGERLHAAACLKILYNPGEEELDMDRLKQWSIETGERYAENSWTSSNFLRWVSTLKVVYPQEVHNFNLSDELLSKLLGNLKIYNVLDIYNHIGCYFSAAMLFSYEQIRDKSMHRSWQDVNYHIENARRSGDWQRYEFLASRTRLLYPDDWQLKTLDRDEVRQIQKRLDNSSFYDHVVSAASWKVLNAESVNFSESGLVIVSKLPALAKSFPIPEFRRI